MRGEDFSGALAGDGGFVAPPVLHHHLHRASRVVRWQYFQAGNLLPQLAQIILTLGQRHRVREHAAQVAELHAAGSDEVVRHAQYDLANDGEVVADQKVVVLDDRASQGVLDGHHRAIGVTPHDRIEHVVELALGHGLQPWAKEAARGFLGKCAVLALECG